MPSIIGMLGLVALAQPAPPEGAASASADSAKAAAAERAKVAAEHCKSRQFETVVTLEVDGKPRKSRIRLCGKQGQSDSDWVRTLKDGAEKIAANDKLPQSAKDQALTAIRAEIDKFTAPAASSIAGAGNYSILPPLPVAPTVPVAPRAEPQASAAYSALPSLPPPAAQVPLPPRVLAAPAALPLLPRPRLDIECLTPGDLGSGGPCVTIQRDTLMTVKAREVIPAGVSLRFVRRGEARAEVALPSLVKGQTRRFKLPIEVCAGGGGGRLDVEILRRAKGEPASRPVGDLGRFELSC